MRPFVRIRDGKWIGGIALGLAYYCGIDVRLIRIGLTALAWLTQGGLALIPLYLILMWCTPMVATPADRPQRNLSNDD